MTEQTNLEDKIRSLLDYWEGFATGKPHHVSAAGVLKQLRDLLPDPPLPDPLFLAKATHPDHGEGMITSHRPDVDGDVRFMFSDEAIGDGTNYHWVSPSTLTFHTQDMSKNGAEIDTSTEHVDPIDTTPDHPEFLEAEEDYENAPEGTIVAYNENKPLVLIDELWRHIGLVGWSDHGDMAGIRRRVLRWGWQA